MCQFLGYVESAALSVRPSPSLHHDALCQSRPRQVVPRTALTPLLSLRRQANDHCHCRCLLLLAPLALSTPIVFPRLTGACRGSFRASEFSMGSASSSSSSSGSQPAPPLAASLMHASLPCRPVFQRVAATSDAVKQEVEEAPALPIAASTVVKNEPAGVVAPAALPTVAVPDSSDSSDSSDSDDDDDNAVKQGAVGDGPFFPQPFPLRWLSPEKMVHLGQDIMQLEITDRSSIGVIMMGPPGTAGMRLDRRRPVTMRLDIQRFFSGNWASPQERDTWWYHHVHMELWGMRPFKRGARAMRGEVHGADRVMQAIIDATAFDIDVAEDDA